MLGGPVHVLVVERGRVDDTKLALLAVKLLDIESRTYALFDNAKPAYRMQYVCVKGARSFPFCQYLVAREGSRVVVELARMPPEAIFFWISGDGENTPAVLARLVYLRPKGGRRLVLHEHFLPSVQGEPEVFVGYGWVVPAARFADPEKVLRSLALMGESRCRDVRKTELPGETIYWALDCKAFAVVFR